ncbi:MAG: hypothetical protein ACE367_14385 [Acidimicrobiales bacterium]
MVGLTVAARTGLWLLPLSAAVLLGWEIASRRIVDRRRSAVARAIEHARGSSPATSDGYEHSITAAIAAAAGNAGDAVLDTAADLVSSEHRTDRWVVELAHERLGAVDRCAASRSPSRVVVASALVLTTTMVIGAWTAAEAWLAPTMVAAVVFGAAHALRQDRRNRIPTELAWYATAPPWSNARSLPIALIDDFIHEVAARGHIDGRADFATEESIGVARLRAVARSATTSLPHGARGPIASVALASCTTTALSHLII